MTDEKIVKVEEHLRTLANIVIDRVLEDKRNGVEIKNRGHKTLG